MGAAVAHGVAKAASNAAAEVANLWIAIVSGSLTTILGVRELLRRRHRRPQLDWRPPKPPPLPLHRVSNAEYRALLHQWEIYSAHIDQYFEDQRGQGQ